jgi:hypothetical protein
MPHQETGGPPGNTLQGKAALVTGGLAAATSREARHVIIAKPQEKDQAHIQGIAVLRERGGVRPDTTGKAQKVHPTPGVRPAITGRLLGKDPKAHIPEVRPDTRREGSPTTGEDTTERRGARARDTDPNTLHLQAGKGGTSAHAS